MDNQNGETVILDTTPNTPLYKKIFSIIGFILPIVTFLIVYLLVQWYFERLSILWGILILILSLASICLSIVFSVIGITGNSNKVYRIFATIGLIEGIIGSLLFLFLVLAIATFN